MTPSAKMISVTVPTTEAYSIGLDETLDIIEFAGRVDYGPKSLSKMGEQDIIRRWIASGHESMVEMVDATFLIECSRVVSHELIRHRLASFQQESQRYVPYEDEDADELFFTPPEVEGTISEAIMQGVYAESQKAYKMLRINGVPKQIARYVLPNATRTRIIVKANLREWRHILRLRLHESAQPEMRQVMGDVHAALKGFFGRDLFPDDIAGERGVR